VIAFSCPSCGKQYTLKPEFAGRATTCSACKHPLVVPSPQMPVPMAAPIESAKIAFSCSKCGMKFSINAEFAGRSSHCPTCKEPLVVPSPNAADRYEPRRGRIDGAPSSLAEAGVDGGVTLAGDFATAEALSLQNLIDGNASEGARYVVESELARGGMGAVMRAVDCDIRREVAVKYLLDQSDTKKKLRFVEEAQITGQLEHPNIVPIHELGVDSEKRIFFSMKMVKGRSLAEILKAQRDGEPSRVSDRVAGGLSGPLQGSARPEDYSQSKLLNILVNVCNALAYAHSRGVVHRDLKPANIMVGDFGEVYVMDWGLAKVLHKEAATVTAPVMAIPVARLATTEPFAFAPVPLAPPVAPSETVVSSASGKVVTSRELDADLTRDGAVLGTPAYMPPEQATGKINDIDERSDVYSMGAILYEILTLQPPVSKEGGYWPILMRVSQGAIEPPEQKAPERARDGKVPPELAAVAMKALAKRKEDRYATVALLRQDIERFLEGRSVSAKQDTIREMAVKLVKRNRGVSIATTAAAVVLSVALVWFLVALLRANSRTRQAYDAYVAEQYEKRLQAKKSVPSLVRAARLLIAEKQFDDALAQLNTAVGFDEAEPESRLVRAQLLVANQEYAAARIDLEACLKQQPRRDEAKNLLQILRDARKDDKATLMAFAEELGRQHVPLLAERITRSAEKLMTSRNELLQLYQVRVEAAWPGQGRNLTLDGNGNYRMTFPVEYHGVGSLEPLRNISLSSFTLFDGRNITEISTLKGMPLSEFVLGNSPVSDLTPLEGARLERFEMNNCPNVSDLGPLKGMPIKTFSVKCQFSQQRLSDLSPLRGMPLKSLSLRACVKVADISPLKGMALTRLDLWGCPVLDLAPLAGMPLTELQFYGAATVHDLSALKGMPLTELTFTAGGIGDLGPLAGLKLTRLQIGSTDREMPIKDLSPLQGMAIALLTFTNCPNVQDLSPLKGMPLKSLQLGNCQVKDLSPLKGMELTSLIMVSPLVKDLEPLRGMPLRSLNLQGCTNVSDLSALGGMKLYDLNVSKCKGADLAPLAGMQLGVLQMTDTPVRDITPLAGMPLTQLHMKNCTELHDLTPLAGMKLNLILLPPNVTKGIDAIRAMKTLQSIDGTSAEQFWKLWDAAKAKSK
jgi:serine/threonine protein kinase